MGSKEVEVTCPCCSSRLTVDVRTEKILKARRPEELDAAGRPKVGEADWDSALGKVTGRLDEGAGKFDASIQREKDRASDLDRLFEDLKRDTSGEAGPDEQDGDEVR